MNVMKKRKSPKIRILELSMGGVYHGGVNVGLIEVMARVFPDLDIVFRSERLHAESVKKRKTTDKEVDYSPWRYFPPVSLKTIFFRDAWGCLYGIGEFLRSKKNDVIFITNLLPFAHRWLCFLNRLFRRELFICLHGQLEALLPGSPLGKTKRYFGLHRRILKTDDRSHYIVLGEPVFEEVKSLFSSRSRVIVIDHPYDYDSAPSELPSYALPLRFGQIGTGNSGKGTQRLFELAALLRPEIEARELEFHLIGRLDSRSTPLGNGLVNTSDHSLSDERFRKKIENLHYTLFLRGKDEARGVPSGSFFDAVKVGKPYLSLENGFVAHYHKRFPGTGSLFPTMEEMAKYIRQQIAAVEAGGFGYDQQVKAFVVMREALSGECIAETFCKQLKP